jgi:molecular chaperone DnaK
VADCVFQTHVQLIEGKLTCFWIYARRPDGTLVDVEPDSLSIRHGLVPAAPPLPYSIGIEIVKPDGRSELDFVFSKGHPLPAERLVHYRAARQLRATQPDGLLAIKVWEGETPEDPDANIWVGAITISSRQIRRVVPEGAEIHLTVRIDESRRVSVDAFLPHSNESFSEGIYLPDREQQDPNEQMKQLPSSIGQLLDRLDAINAATAQCEDSTASEEVDRLRTDLEDLDLVASRSADLSDDPDLASRSVERAREVRRRLVALEKGTGAGNASEIEIEKARQEANPTKEVTEKFGSAMEKRELAMLMRDLERASNRGDVRSARRVSEQLQSLRWRVLFNQDWFWKEALEAQQCTGHSFVNQQEAHRWLEAGEEAARKGDSLTLREAVKHLWQLQPKSDTKLDRERAMQAGLRRF